MTQVTIGGERLGAGNREKVWLHNYNRSTHDIGYVWRSTMASGTLVPFMSELALPGDTFDINLEAFVLTHPTIGPLFGTYKIQLDVFQIPIRLYEAQLHMNRLGIGRDMSKVKLPQLFMEAMPPDPLKPIDNQQINPSSIFSYLGIRGLGWNGTTPENNVLRTFNAVPFLAYWDIYKNYYANKQEEIGAVIHKNLTPTNTIFVNANLENSLPPINITVVDPPVYIASDPIEGTTIVINTTGLTDQFDPSQVLFDVNWVTSAGTFNFLKQGGEMFETWDVYTDAQILIGSKPTAFALQPLEWGKVSYLNINSTQNYDAEPQITTFPLANIDNMRFKLLQYPPDSIDPYYIGLNPNTEPPYSLPFESHTISVGVFNYAKQYNQEGLALKTYNSDLFNNWIQTEWIDGADGVSAVTAIDTSGGSFTIDELNLSKKIYDMLNRIAISGGSYDDWLDAVYTHERTRSAENPMYIGGLIKNLVFQEVISNSASQVDGEHQPLGTLAGRGTIGNKHKGGKIIAKIDEPSYIMGIVSITPNIDYSQGNKWDMNLETMNDFHKPALDAIGFQDLITDQMAWFDTSTTYTTGNPVRNFKSAGKQPAWINYMTNVNQVRGNFAEQSQQMFMTLNRRYQPKWGFPAVNSTSIKDLTTYIDPRKFNHIFADTRRDAQNFWTQIGVDIKARRKMSAKVIPNL